MNSCRKVNAQKLLFIKHDEGLMHICYAYTAYHARIFYYFVHDVDFMHNRCALNGANAQKVSQLVQQLAAQLNRLILPQRFSVPSLCN